MNLAARFAEQWKEKAFVKGPAPVLLAVSGGLDSMVMAHLFAEAGVSIAVGHCNFRLRGADADEDEAFTRAWCSSRNVPFHTTGFNTKEIAERWKKGIQETARILRYEWLEQIRSAQGYSALATAHHADDNAETMLLNLCRGTGIAGLHGIPERNGAVIRPLLFAGRNDLAGYAAEKGIAHREDASNGSDSYLRNALRHHVLPVLEQWMPGAAQRIMDTSMRIGQAEILYRRAVDKERGRLLEQRGKDHYIPVRLLRHRTPLETILFELIHPFGFTAAQVAPVLELLGAESGKYIASPTHRVIRNRDFLIVTALPAQEADFILVEGLPVTVATPDGDFHFTEIKSPERIPDDPGVAFLDAAQLSFPLILRRRRAGDYFYPLGMGMKKKKVSRFLTDGKVALHEKEKVWILESAGRIVWVAGMRPDERFKVRPSTGTAIRVAFR